ncbi:MAG: UDP-N-acetylmuramate dehydrogenase, partial [Patescibacteria group bacterium]
TVGGAIRGNAGTWSTEIKDVLQRVEFLDTQHANGGVQALTAAECNFAHRESIFKHRPNWIILRGTFQLVSGDPVEGEKLVQQDIKLRRERQPYDAPSSGSIFKNPPGKFAGALLEQAGMKGLTVGGAEISSLHANWILNRGRATSQDIRQLIEQAQVSVLKTSGVQLEPEVVLVNPH